MTEAEELVQKMMDESRGLTRYEQQMAAGIGQVIGEEIAPLLKRISELESRIAELEKGGIKYAGTYQRAQEYKRGTMVTYDGSLWCALSDTQATQVPGSDKIWQLAVKSTQQDKPRQPTAPLTGART